MDGYKIIVLAAGLLFGSARGQAVVRIQLDSTQVLPTPEDVRVWNRGTTLTPMNSNTSLTKLNDSTISVGLVIPQHTSRERDALPKPPNGPFLIYNKDSKRLNYRREDKWVSIWGDL